MKILIKSIAYTLVGAIAGLTAAASSFLFNKELVVNWWILSAPFIFALIFSAIAAKATKEFSPYFILWVFAIAIGTVSYPIIFNINLDFGFLFWLLSGITTPIGALLGLYIGNRLFK